MNPRVIGIDPSMTATGLVTADGEARTVRGRDCTDRRLRDIYAAVYEAATGCSLAVIEDLPTHAHGAGITGMVQGVVRLALMRADCQYAVVPPATLKRYATGKGNATKPDMRMALFQRMGLDLRDDNQVDAIWLRMLGLDWMGEPVVDLPKLQRDSIAKCRWPILIRAEAA